MLDQFSPIAQRLILSGLAIILIVLAILSAYSPLFSWLPPLVAAAAFTIALKEYYDLAKIKGYQPQEKAGYFLSVAYAGAIYLTSHSQAQELLPLGAIATTLLVLFIELFFTGNRPLSSSAITLFGIVYLVIPLNCTLFILYSPPQLGMWWVFYLLAVTYATNALALFFGKAMGRRKMAPFISPSKTWEGAAGGFITAIGVSAAFSLWAPISLSLGAGLLLGAWLGILAQIGDLAESLLKRDAKVKDSSNIPGIGGMLDIVDSLIFTAPFLYLFLKLFPFQ